MKRATTLAAAAVAVVLAASACGPSDYSASDAAQPAGARRPRAAGPPPATHRARTAGGHARTDAHAA
ncbi:hypothetical protein ACFVZN_25970, partial [Streptomyces virginiae]